LNSPFRLRTFTCMFYYSKPIQLMFWSDAMVESLTCRCGELHVHVFLHTWTCTSVTCIYIGAQQDSCSHSKVYYMWVFNNSEVMVKVHVLCV
jgi:hypothetical protein